MRINFVVKKNILFVLLLACFAINGRAQLYDSAAWIPNGPVNSILQLGDKLLLGGRFNYFGEPTGAGVVLDTASGTYNIVFPKVNGPIHALAHDGYGGWYIGGEFTNVGGYPIKNIARITNKGLVVTSFAPNPNGPVYAIYVTPTNAQIKNPRPNVYVGGNFTSIGGKLRSNLAVINPYGGAVYDNWAPKVSGPVYCIEKLSTYRLLIGGAFNSVDGTSYSNIFKVSTLTLSYVIPKHYIDVFNLSVNGSVRTIHVISPNKIYIGGGFNVVQNQSRPHIACVENVSSQTPTVTQWNPAPNKTVYSIAKRGNLIIKGGMGSVGPVRISGQDTDYPNSNFTDSTLLFGGEFTTVNGQSAKYICEVSTDSLGSTINKDFKADNTVKSIFYSAYKYGNKIYAGGDFKNIGGQPRRFLAVMDSNGVAIPGFSPEFSDPVNTICLADSQLYVGGNFLCMNGVEKFSLAEFDTLTSKPTLWNPVVSGEINTMCLSSNNLLYIGGNFTLCDTAVRYNIACYDINNGAFTPFKAFVKGHVKSMILEEQRHRIFIGGLFSQMGSKTRNNTGCIDTYSNEILNWHPNVNGIVNDMCYKNGYVYIAGFFNKSNGYTHENITQVDTAAGFPNQAFSPYTDESIYSIAEYNNNFILGGWFNQINSMNSNYTGLLNPTTGNATAPLVSTNSVVKKIQLQNNYIFFGGLFSQANNLKRTCLAEYDIASQTLTPFAPNLDNSPKSFYNYQNYLYTGGDFVMIDKDFHPYFVKLNRQWVAENTEPNSIISSITLFPNPCSDYLFVQTNNYKSNIISYTIFDITGKAIIKETNSATNMIYSIDVASLSAGIYFITFSDNPLPVALKFIKTD